VMQSQLQLQSLAMAPAGVRGQLAMQASVGCWGPKARVAR
jgi:hypothetical protein